MLEWTTALDHEAGRDQGQESRSFEETGDLEGRRRPDHNLIRGLGSMRLEGSVTMEGKRGL